MYFSRQEKGMVTECFMYCRTFVCSGAADDILSILQWREWWDWEEVSVRLIDIKFSSKVMELGYTSALIFLIIVPTYIGFFQW